MIPTKIIATGILFAQCAFGIAFGDELSDQIQITRSACSGISNAMDNLKKMAGINTAVTAVGTVTGGVALGTGIAKASVDSELNALIEKVQKLIDEKSKIPVEKIDVKNRSEFEQQLTEISGSISSTNERISELEQKSKTLGNIRTGTLAATAVADTAGTIIAAKNKVDDDLQSRIDNCVTAVKRLSTARASAQAAKTTDTAEISKANTIINACRDWEYVNLTDINKKARGAAISSGTGAALAIVGTITSASANSDSTRQNDDKEKSLNTASNVLAGGATGASAVATIFNATQISAIKKAVNIAEKCEGALN